MKITAIEITFPVAVELTNEEQQELDAFAGRICDRWQSENPGRVMWPAGIGCKPTYIPMTAEEEQTRGIEFDEGTFQISCSERADYECKCAKCGKPQGDHKDHIIDPPAGDCDFTVRNA